MYTNETVVAMLRGSAKLNQMKADIDRVAQMVHGFLNRQWPGGSNFSKAPPIKVFLGMSSSKEYKPTEYWMHFAPGMATPGNLMSVNPTTGSENVYQCSFSASQLPSDIIQAAHANLHSLLNAVAEQYPAFKNYVDFLVLSA